MHVLRLPLPLLLLVACAEPPRRSVGVPVTLQSVADTVPDGVTLSRAELSLDAIRLRGGEVAALRWLPVALAHPGHEPSEGLVGEWLGPRDLDLLAGHDLGEAAVYAGAVSTGELAFTEGSSGVLEGEAVVGARSVPFRFVLPEPGASWGIVVDGLVDAEDPPELALAIDLGPVLDAVPWEDAPDGTWTVDDDEALRNTLLFHLRSATTWTLEIE